MASRAPRLLAERDPGRGVLLVSSELSEILTLSDRIFVMYEGRIVHVKIPFWLLRMKMRGTTIDFNGNKMNFEDLKLTVEDLERFGPTLIVDHRSSSGERVMVWSQ